MRFVRAALRPRAQVLDRDLRPSGRAAANPAAAVLRMESLVLDLLYVLGVIVLFVIVGLVAKAVEKL